MAIPVPRLYLVRHGETEWSRFGRHTSRTELPLTAEGERAAERLGERLRLAGILRTFSSPRQRAVRTCELAGWGPPPELEPDLAEWHYGEYEGLRSGEIRGNRPGWEIFRDGCPGGETPAQVSDRADRLIARLRRMDGPVALCSHGHMGCVLAVRWIGLPVSAGRHFALHTAAFGVLGYESNHPDVPVIALWNWTALEGSPVAPEVPATDAAILKLGALDRWENEGGEIPAAARLPTET